MFGFVHTTQGTVQSTDTVLLTWYGYGVVQQGTGDLSSTKCYQNGCGNSRQISQPIIQVFCVFSVSFLLKDFDRLYPLENCIPID